MAEPLRGKPKMRIVGGNAKRRDQQKRKPVDTDERNYFAALHRFVDEIFVAADEEFDMDWHQLASAAKLSYQTVWNIGERMTWYPRFQTIYKLAKAVGREIRFSDLKKPKTAKMRLRQTKAA